MPSPGAAKSKASHSGNVGLAAPGGNPGIALTIQHVRIQDASLSSGPCFPERASPSTPNPHGHASKVGPKINVFRRFQGLFPNLLALTGGGSAAYRFTPWDADQAMRM